MGGLWGLLRKSSLLSLRINRTIRKEHMYKQKLLKKIDKSRQQHICAFCVFRRINIWVYLLIISPTFKLITFQITYGMKLLRENSVKESKNQKLKRIFVIFAQFIKVETKNILRKTRNIQTHTHAYAHPNDCSLAICSDEETAFHIMLVSR